MSATDETTLLSPQPRRWPIALLVAFICGGVGAAIAVPVSDWAMEAHHVSSMEGGRACAAIGLWAPLAFILSGIVSFVVALKINGSGFAGYVKRQIAGLLLTVAGVLSAGGLGYAMADHPPTIDGQYLGLEIELRVPTKGRSIEQLKAAGFDVALVVSAADRNFAEMRWSDAVRTDESITIPAWSSLNSSSAGREITAGVRGENRQIMNVMLPAQPRATDRTWSEWAPSKARFDGTKPPAEDAYLVRYRVRFWAEHSPTPVPTPPREESSPPQASTAEM